MKTNIFTVTIISTSTLPSPPWHQTTTTITPYHHHHHTYHSLYNTTLFHCRPAGLGRAYVRACRHGLGLQEGAYQPRTRARGVSWYVLLGWVQSRPLPHAHDAPPTPLDARVVGIPPLTFPSRSLFWLILWFLALRIQFFFRLIEVRLCILLVCPFFSCLGLMFIYYDCYYKFYYQCYYHR